MVNYLEKQTGLEGKNKFHVILSIHNLALFDEKFLNQQSPNIVDCKHSLQSDVNTIVEFKKGEQQ